MATDLDALRAELRESTPFWAERFAKIRDKQGRLIPLVPKAGQLALDEALEAQRAAGKPMRAIVLKARQIGFCLDPATRVLTSDLRWVPIESLRPGDQLVATDEMPPGPRRGRRLRVGEVEGRREVFERAYRLRMDNGEELVATGPHRFLCKKRGAVDTQWRTVEHIRVGDEIRHITQPWDETDIEDAWIGGILDGEGCLRKDKGEVTISQRHGRVYDRAAEYLRRNGFTFREDLDARGPGSSKLGRDPVGRLVVNRLNDLFRLLGKCRPVRFPENWWEGRELPGKRSGVAWAKVVAVEPLGEQRMIDLQTSTQTFIAEGFVSHNSTWIQAKLCHRATLREHYDAVTVAHDKETGGKLFRMFETIYINLPEDRELKPDAHTYRRSQYLHLGGDGLRHAGDIFPDSRYTVDTAGEFQAGRGGTYRAIHASECAFWSRINEKLTALMSAVPDDPETLFVMESTANGYNEFKDRWDDAESGRNADWIAFFWPWFKEPDYRMAFASETEAERFMVGDPTHPYAEEEPELVERFELEPEQLNWRRQVISAKFGGDIRFFDQEYPATPQHAFIATGRKVFDSYKLSRLAKRVEFTDPRQPTEECPGPRVGDFKGIEHRPFPTPAGGTIEVPTKVLWTPRPRGVASPMPPWRFWLESDGRGGLKRPSQYVIAVDVSGANTESTEEADYHAVQVIDHKTLEQVAEYRSRIDPDLVALEVLMAALFFNKALVAVERTGGWGGPVARILYHDYHYPHVYRSKKVGNATERIDQRLGWDTNVRTKPELIAHATELLRDEVDGIRSRLLVGEMQTYTRTEKGVAEAEPKKYDDLLMAWMIAQQVAKESFMRGQAVSSPRHTAHAPSSLGAYDARLR